MIKVDEKLLEQLLEPLRAVHPMQGMALLAAAMLTLVYSRVKSQDWDQAVADMQQMLLLSYLSARDDARQMVAVPEERVLDS